MQHGCQTDQASVTRLPQFPHVQASSLAAPASAADPPWRALTPRALCSARRWNLRMHPLPPVAPAAAAAHLEQEALRMVALARAAQRRPPPCLHGPSPCSQAVSLPASACRPALAAATTAVHLQTPAGHLGQWLFMPCPCPCPCPFMTSRCCCNMHRVSSPSSTFVSLACGHHSTWSPASCPPCCPPSPLLCIPLGRSSGSGGPQMQRQAQGQPSAVLFAEPEFRTTSFLNLESQVGAM